MKIKVGRYSVEVTNPDKILFPWSKITKEEFVSYYYRIAPLMLAYVKNRPLTMDRFPHGIAKETFYQKDTPDFFPSYISRQPVKKNDGGIVEYPLITKPAALVYIANYVCVPHVWLSKVPRLHYPDRMIFDLDPSPRVDFQLVKWSALQLKKVLEFFSLSPFLMTTGSRGLHVIVPLRPTTLFDEVRDVARQIAELLVQKYPAKLTLQVRKTERGKRVFIDTLRNAWSATSVAPYAIRAQEGAPIATPIAWKELSEIRSSQQFTIKNINIRLDRIGDIWKDMHKKACSLKSVQKKLKNKEAINLF